MTEEQDLYHTAYPVAATSPPAVRLLDHARELVATTQFAEGRGRIMAFLFGLNLWAQRELGIVMLPGREWKRIDTPGELRQLRQLLDTLGAPPNELPEAEDGHE